MRLDAAFDEVFASASHVRMLRALFGLPAGTARSARDLARRAGISHPRASQVLTELAGVGLVKLERVPRADLYRLNQQHVLLGPLGELFDLEEGLKAQLVEQIATELKARRVPVKQARVFGSVARGEMTSDSDVDLALVSSPAMVGAVESAGQEIGEALRERFGTRVNVLVGSPSLDALAKSRYGKRAVWQAIEREGIDVLAPATARN